MLEPNKLSKFVSHKARISGEFGSRKDSYPTKLEWEPRILVKLSFRELCDSKSKLSGLHTFDMTTSLSQKDPWSKNSSVIIKWHLGISEISTSPEIAVGVHFHMWHGTKTTPIFLPADWEASWVLRPSSFSLLSGSTVQKWYLICYFLGHCYYAGEKLLYLFWSKFLNFSRYFMATIFFAATFLLANINCYANKEFTSVSLKYH